MKTQALLQGGGEPVTHAVASVAPSDKQQVFSSADGDLNQPPVHTHPGRCCLCALRRISQLLL